MKNKILLVITLFLSLFIFVGCKSNKFVVSIELTSHNAALANHLDELNKMTVNTDIRVNIYENETAPNPYFFQTSYSKVDIDYDNNYLYLFTSLYGLDDTKEIYQSVEGGTLHIYTEDNILKQEILARTEDISSFLGDSSEDETSFIIIKEDDTITKDEETGIFTLTMKVANLVESDVTILDQMLGSNTVDDLIVSDISITFTYLFNEDDTELVQTISIPRYLDQAFGVFVSVDIETTLSAVDTISENSIDPNLYYCSGPTTMDGGVFTLEPNREHTIYVGREDNNYYAFELEEGYYVIDNEFRMQNYVDIEVYDSEGNPVPGNAIYEIKEAGTYYVNFVQKKYTNIDELIFVNKINELEVGTPSNPLIHTNTVLQIDSKEENAFLLMEEAPTDGMIVLMAPIDSDILAYARMGSQGAYMVYDSTWNSVDVRYGFVQVKQGDTVIIEFVNGFYGSSEVAWYFLSQEELTSDLSTMPEISLSEPTLIYLTEDGSQVNYKVTVTEEGTYMLFPTMEYAIALWGSYGVAIYDENFQIVSYDALFNQVTLIPGTYIIRIIDIDKIHYYPFLADEQENNFILFALFAWIDPA